MEKQNNDARNIFLGVVIGGIIGGSALYFLKASRNSNKSAMCKLGKTMSDLGEILEETSIDNKKDAINEIGNAIEDKDGVLTNALNWAATGIALWKKIKRGM